MKLVFKKHWVAIVFAFTIGILTFSPEFLIIYKHKNEAFVYPINNDDELYYLSRAQEVRDGNYLLSNPYLYEHKDVPALQFWVPDVFLSKTGKFLGLSVPATYVVYDLIFPIILALTTYLILYHLTKVRLLAVSGMILLHAGLFFEEFNRSPSPQFNFIFFLILFYTLLRWVEERKWKWAISSALVLGALFSIYTYYWTYFFVLIPLFLFFMFAVLRSKELLLQGFGVVLGALVIGIPYFIQTTKSITLPFYSETLERLGMLNTHFPSGFFIVLLSGVVLLVIVFMLRKKILEFNPLMVFILSSLVSIPVVVNQHVITGKNLEFSSHYAMLSIFVIVFIGYFLIAKIFEQDSIKKLVFLKRAQFIVITIIFIFSVVSLWGVVGKQFTSSSLSEAENQRYAQLFTWLNLNTDRESVVYADGELSSFIPAYTHNNVYWAREANLHFMSNNEVVERYLISEYFNNSFSEDVIRVHERDVWGTQYINKWGKFSTESKLKSYMGIVTQPIERIPVFQIEYVKVLYVAMQKRDFLDLVHSYRVDYVVWDEKINPVPHQIARFKKLYTINGLSVFDIRQDKKTL